MLSINYHYSRIRDEDTELQLQKSDLLQDKQLKIRRKTLVCFSSIPRYFNFTNTQTNIQANLDTTWCIKDFGCDFMTGNHIYKEMRWSQLLWQHPGSHVPKTLKVLVGWRIKLRMYWRRRLQQESRIHIPRLFFSCSHEELFSRIVSILTSIFMDCILCAWSCAKF